MFPADAGSGGPPRPGVAPVTPARYTARNPGRSSWMIFADELECHSTADRIYLDAMQGQRSHILPGCRESACGPPALWFGAPLQAAAGRATTVKLQTNKESKCWPCLFAWYEMPGRPMPMLSALPCLRAGARACGGRGRRAGDGHAVRRFLNQYSLFQPSHQISSNTAVSPINGQQSSSSFDGEG